MVGQDYELINDYGYELFWVRYGVVRVKTGTT